ncbi:hypothetical protein BGZ80_010034 [Entomortierella chlamydospora]|uniref:FAD-binding domain-containing protein n=1 Tax=Entomortierella chlamydospora TaxID=101097 RepID=A0A9P6MWN9_9FUNG|nr:hypothetical protein BGZ80_010034 [Entomortierella chlamydospora]
MRDNRICWGVICQVESASASRDAMFRNSDWGSEGDEGVMHGAFDKTTPVGGTVRDLFEATPKENISKVFLEDKLFETWYYGRTVLIGDACHKFLPSAGQGAVNAMQDAVILANCIYEMGEATPENITAVFKEYYDERYEPVKKMMAKSRFMALVMYGTTFKERMFRHIIVNWVPSSTKFKQYLKDTVYRPQASFLDYVENHGTSEVLPQKPSRRYAEEKAVAKGSAMALDAKIMPVFEQLGLLDELLAISLPCKGINILDPELKLMTGLDFKDYKKRTGYEMAMFVRPRLHRLLLSHIPSEKVIFSKKVVSLEQNEQGVTLAMSDGTTVHGDILVGADGTYSGVRQGLFKNLDKEGLLPASDKEELSMGHLCMVGTTNPVDPEKYPCVSDDRALFQRVIEGGDPHTWHTVNVCDNKICWGIILQIDSAAASRDAMFRLSDWGSEGDEGVMSGAYDKVAPTGGLVRDLFDATPEEEISKVFLEEKLFKTWYHGRTVLIGDACHKFLPSAGQGAVNALQDAVILANCIYEMGEATPENITAAFKEYYNERYEPVKKMMAKSRFMALIMYGMVGAFLPFSDIEESEEAAIL